MSEVVQVSDCTSVDILTVPELKKAIKSVNEVCADIQMGVVEYPLKIMKKEALDMAETFFNERGYATPEDLELPGRFGVVRTEPDGYSILFLG